MSDRPQVSQSGQRVDNGQVLATVYSPELTTAQQVYVNAIRWSKDALAVPTEAIVDTGEIQYVFVSLPGGRFEPRRVRTGARTEERVQVLEGLAAGETVVTTANFLVDSESRLRAAVEGFTPRDDAAERTFHDFTLRYALGAVPGVAEVASVGGYQKPTTARRSSTAPSRP